MVSSTVDCDSGGDGAIREWQYYIYSILKVEPTGLDDQLHVEYELKKSQGWQETRLEGWSSHWLWWRRLLEEQFGDKKSETDLDKLILGWLLDIHIEQSEKQLSV